MTNPVDPTPLVSAAPPATAASPLTVNVSVDPARVAEVVKEHVAALVPVRLSPSQTRHPWRATVRTVLAGVIGAASVIPDVVTIAHFDGGTLAAVGGQAVAVSAVVTRIIAIPTVNGWLTKLGLGAEPKQSP